MTEQNQSVEDATLGGTPEEAASEAASDNAETTDAAQVRGDVSGEAAETEPAESEPQGGES